MYKIVGQQNNEKRLYSRHISTPVAPQSFRRQTPTLPPPNTTLSPLNREQLRPLPPLFVCRSQSVGSLAFLPFVHAPPCKMPHPTPLPTTPSHSPSAAPPPTPPPHYSAPQMPFPNTEHGCLRLYYFRKGTNANANALAAAFRALASPTPLLSLYRTHTRPPPSPTPSTCPAVRRPPYSSSARRTVGLSAHPPAFPPSSLPLPHSLQQTTPPSSQMVEGVV